MITYFQNPGWPEASRDRIICTLTVELQPDVTQVLLNFILFEVSFGAFGKHIFVLENRLTFLHTEAESTDRW